MTRIFQPLLLFIALLQPFNAHSEGWEFDFERTKFGDFALGLAGGILAHEAGHYVVATSKGYKVGRDGLSITYPGAKFAGTDQLKIASAGFQTQWLLAELIFRNGSGKQLKSAPDDFGAGIVCAHLAITAAYAIYLKDHQLGDVVGMSEATGLSNNQIMLALAVPGALDAWRLFGNDVPEWVPELSVLGKGLGIAWAWTY